MVVHLASHSLASQSLRHSSESVFNVTGCFQCLIYFMAWVFKTFPNPVQYFVRFFSGHLATFIFWLISRSLASASCLAFSVTIFSCSVGCLEIRNAGFSGIAGPSRKSLEKASAEGGRSGFMCFSAKSIFGL
jgi:hypothetical protein